MPGPPPKHPSARARRNNAKSDFRTLPSIGRTGKTPRWPLTADLAMQAALETGRDRIANLQVELEDCEDRRRRGRIQRDLNRLEMSTAELELKIEQAADAEEAMWVELWAMPQAVMWEEAHANREVAQYVRWKIRAEQGDLKAGVEARQLSDRLGLNPLALLRLRAEVEQVTRAEDENKRRREKRGSESSGKKKPDDPRGFLDATG